MLMTNVVDVLLPLRLLLSFFNGKQNFINYKQASQQNKTENEKTI